jgi:hypothetical protein
MLNNSKEYREALEIFKLQIDCVEKDNREKQLQLYSKNLHYEFPFANDRPRIIDGVDNFKEVMSPIWERRRKNNIDIQLVKYEFYSADERGLYIVVFDLKAIFCDKNESVTSTCIQFIKIVDGLITAVKEYFEP